MRAMVPDLLIGGLVGAAIGLVFFGGLWGTVRRLPMSRRPAALAAVSLLARLGVAAAGFAWIATRGADALIAALGGFLAIRFAAVRLVAGREGG